MTDTGARIVKSKARKPYEPKLPSITLDQLHEHLASVGAKDVKIEQRYRPGKSELITLRFGDSSRMVFSHAKTNRRDPDAVRRGVLEFVGSVQRAAQKAIDEAVASKTVTATLDLTEGRPPPDAPEPLPPPVPVPWDAS